MPDLLVLFAWLSQCLERTTIRQLRRVAEARLSMTGRVTRRGISRGADNGGSYRTIPRVFTTSLSWGTRPWGLSRHPCGEHEDVLCMGGEEVVVPTSGQKTYGVERLCSAL
jgi:hypothetical protein